MVIKSNQLLKKLINGGFIHIVTSGAISRILLFAGSFLIVRILSIEENGVFQTANNIVSMFMLISGLGTLSAVFQFACESHENQLKRRSYFRYGFNHGVLFNLLLASFLMLYSFFVPIEIEGVSGVLLAMSTLPITNYIAEAIPIFLRSEFDNKGFSFFNALSSVFRVISLIVLAWLYNIWGAVLSMHLANVFSLILIIIIKREFFTIFKQKILLGKGEKKAFWKISIVSMLNNSISHLLYNIDVFMMSIMIPLASIVATYKTATLIPFALNFIPLTIVIFVWPYFAKHINDKLWLRTYYIMLVKYFGVFNFLVSLTFIFFANEIVVLIFGSDYEESVLPFRILMVGYFFASTFRIVSGNILVALRKVTFNLIVSSISGLLNILLNFILIHRFGMIGAAFSTLAIMILSSIASTIYLWHILWFSNSD